MSDGYDGTGHDDPYGHDDPHGHEHHDPSHDPSAGRMLSRSHTVLDHAAAATFSRRFFTTALEHELLLRPIGHTVYLMPPYILDEAEIDGLAARTLAVFEQVIGGHA